jgi:hypothetical protein
MMALHLFSLPSFHNENVGDLVRVGVYFAFVLVFSFPFLFFSLFLSACNFSVSFFYRSLSWFFFIPVDKCDYCTGCMRAMTDIPVL